MKCPWSLTKVKGIPLSLLILMMIITLINSIVKLLCGSSLMAPNSDPGLIAMEEFSCIKANQSGWRNKNEVFLRGKKLCLFYHEKESIEPYTTYSGLPLLRSCDTADLY